MYTNQIGNAVPFTVFDGLGNEVFSIAYGDSAEGGDPTILYVKAYGGQSIVLSTEVPTISDAQYMNLRITPDGGIEVSGGIGQPPVDDSTWTQIADHNGLIGGGGTGFPPYTGVDDKTGGGVGIEHPIFTSVNKLLLACSPLDIDVPAPVNGAFIKLSLINVVTSTTVIPITLAGADWITVTGIEDVSQPAFMEFYAIGGVWYAITSNNLSYASTTGSSLRTIN